MVVEGAGGQHIRRDCRLPVDSVGEAVVLLVRQPRLPRLRVDHMEAVVHASQGQQISRIWILLYPPDAASKINLVDWTSRLTRVPTAESLVVAERKKMCEWNKKEEISVIYQLDVCAIINSY